MSTLKKNDELKWTNNSSYFNKLRKIYERRGQWCIYCAPYQGCNGSRKESSKYKLTDHKCWKRYRKHQWK